MPSISPKQYRLTIDGPSPKSLPSIGFETRLFYVRIGPCAVENSPEFLALRHLSGELGVPLEINGSRFPEVTSTLRRDRVDQESSEVTYVGTDSVRITGSVGFEVYEKDDLLLCGSIERLESDWNIDCYAGVSPAFFRPKVGVSSQSIEVYVAGRCSGVPVILTKMINVSTRRKHRRHCPLDAIPEVEDEIEKDDKVGNGLIWHGKGKLQLNETEDEYESEKKIADGWYPEYVYEGEDGQLTWFNAGVRVGVGIGLGMCLGVGIGVGLLMRSYQTTTRNFRRRFF